MFSLNDRSGVQNQLARAFLTSFAMSLTMMLMAFGFMYLFDPNSAHELPVSTAIILVVFALSFIASAVLLERSGMAQAPALIGGAAIAMGLTMFLVSIMCGVFYLYDGMLELETDTLITGFAVCLILSVVIDRLVLKF
ncbi:hypothetical protein CUJ83_01165 [Methanocella sp. CWC-04]|uniref:Uncharacterized protein n=1 Tax=Methanooceanicella nereidis TaxID=2052831 RepID=A0AAP2W4T5_9EURY|nr:hypothetical protein [Methanocella sp. CWC-04]